jgi:hypothetical protein
MLEYPLDQVATTPYLPREEQEGWVTLGDGITKVEWTVKEPIYLSAKYKALCERIAAEAALMKGQTEVIIR